MYVQSMYMKCITNLILDLAQGAQLQGARHYIKVLDYSNHFLVWLLFECIACRKCYILLFVL
jgi:hypothetical protein